MTVDIYLLWKNVLTRTMLVPFVQTSEVNPANLMATEN